MTPRRIVPVLLVLALGASACASTLRPAAAVVNGTRITQEQVDAALATQPAAPGADRTETARGLLFQLIQQELVAQEAAKRDVQADPARVEAQLDQIRQGFPSEEEFRRAAEQRGFTLESLRETIADQLLADALAAELGGPITAESVRTVYNVEKQRFEQRRARQIQLNVEDPSKDEDVRERAELLRARIRAGESFASVAREESQDPQSASEGGSLGELTLRSPIAPELLNQIFSAEEDAVEGPVRTQFGYHIVRVDRISQQPLADVEDEIRAELERRRTQETLTELIPTVLREADIVINPRYGTWDPAQAAIVPYRFYEPAEPEVAPGGPPGIQFPPQG